MARSRASWTPRTASRLGGSLAVVAVSLTLAGSASASSLSREAIRPALLAAVEQVRDCTATHYLVSGRYSVWIEVDVRGRGRAKLRETPGPLPPRAERCLLQAFEAQRYPTVGEALVAFSAASPPGRTYSISYPFVLVASAGELVGGIERRRPKPARHRALARETSAPLVRRSATR